MWGVILFVLWSVLERILTAPPLQTLEKFRLWLSLNLFLVGYILMWKKFFRIKTENGYKFTTQDIKTGLYYLWSLFFITVIIMWPSFPFGLAFSIPVFCFVMYKQRQWNKSCGKCHAIGSYEYASTAEKNSYRTSINKTMSHRNSKGDEYATSNYSVPGTEVVEKQIWRCGHCNHGRYETKTSTYAN